MPGTLHIIGGGLSGLSAAVDAAGCGKRIALHEASGQCGGRARSFYDKSLDRVINNGNHLFFTSNDTLLRYIEIIGAKDTITGPTKPLFPFYDNETTDRWDLVLPSPLSLPVTFSPNHGVKGMRPWDVIELIKLLYAGKDQTVSEFIKDNAFSRRMLVPLTIAVLNTMPDEASAFLLANVLKETLFNFKRPRPSLARFAKKGLSATLVDPALDYLKLLNADIYLKHCLTGLRTHHGRVKSLIFGEEEIELSAYDRVILAVPSYAAHGLLVDHIPGFSVPDEFESIANIHFRVAKTLHPVDSLAKAHFIGIIGGFAEWVFVNHDTLSVTISAANRYRKMKPGALTSMVWKEVRRACSTLLEEPLPAEPVSSRLIWEKRATFKATPAQQRVRVGAATPLVNLALCGDWTDTFLPATLEGSVRSGITAVEALGLKQPGSPMSI